ncbi:MAG: M3 family oligoendopeptidase [Erysipelotrichia bacterium]|nr:M3 family oligoendopeptidase [Erysipelotrichia bacterium]
MFFIRKSDKVKGRGKTIMSKKAIKFSHYPFVVPDEKKVIAKFEQLVTQLAACQNAKEAEVALNKINKYIEKLRTDISIIYVKYSCDTRNEEYKKAQDVVDEMTPIFGKYNNQLIKILTTAPYRPELEKKFGPFLFKKYDAKLKTFDEKIMPELMQESKLTSEYDLILGGAQIDYEGQILNLSQLGKYLQDKDRKTRKGAAKAMDNWLKENESRLGQIYNELVRIRHEMALKLGFKNFTELAYLRLGRTDYTPDMVANYRQQVYEEVVPLSQKLYRAQMKNLGIKKPQYYDYNLMFNSGNPLPAGDSDYLVKQAQEMYAALGKESKEFFDFMIENELMDLEARSGKAPGGYCTYFPLYKSPFIFSNFNGTQDDVNVLCHGGGRAFQAYLSKDNKVPEYRNPTLERCEIHSMSMEFFAWPYVENFFGKDGEKYKYLHLVSSIGFLPYGITIDEFQHWVYEHPIATHDERCAAFREIESRYTPHKKYDDTPALAKGTYWLRQAHVFGSPFYYIDYTLAQVVAFQFAIENNKDHEKAWKKYVKLCKCGGKYPFLELLAKNRLRNPFKDGNIRKVIKPLTKVLKSFDIAEM